MLRIRPSTRVTAIILVAACLQLVPLVRPAPSTLADHSATVREGDEVRATGVEVLLPDEPPHIIANVRKGDLIGDGSPQVFVTEPLRGRVAWLRGQGEPLLLTEGLIQPVRTHAVDIDGDGDRDLLVADIGSLVPTDDKVGRVVLLRNRGAFDFEPQVLLKGVGRVACAEAADLDGDDDLDIVVCVFGDVTGKVLWLEQKDGFTFEERFPQICLARARPPISFQLFAGIFDLPQIRLNCFPSLWISFFCRIIVYRRDDDDVFTWFPVPGRRHLVFCR